MLSELIHPFVAPQAKRMIKYTVSELIHGVEVRPTTLQARKRGIKSVRAKDQSSTLE